MSLLLPQEYVEGQFATPAIDLGVPLRDASDAGIVGAQRATAPDRLEAALESAWRRHHAGVWADREARADALERVASALEAQEDALGPARTRSSPS